MLAIMIVVSNIRLHEAFSRATGLFPKLSQHRYSELHASSRSPSQQRESELQRHLPDERTRSVPDTDIYSRFRNFSRAHFPFFTDRYEGEEVSLFKLNMMAHTLLSPP